MEFSFHTTFNSTQQQHVQKHYSSISRPQKFYLKIGSQKLDLYTLYMVYNSVTVEDHRTYWKNPDQKGGKTGKAVTSYNYIMAGK